MSVNALKPTGETTAALFVNCNKTKNGYECPMGALSHYGALHVTRIAEE